MLRSLQNDLLTTSIILLPSRHLTGIVWAVGFVVVIYDVTCYFVLFIVGRIEPRDPLIGIILTRLPGRTRSRCPGNASLRTASLYSSSIVVIVVTNFITKEQKHKKN